MIDAHLLQNVDELVNQIKDKEEIGIYREEQHI